MKNLFFAIVCLISLNALAQDRSKLILGTWVYADIYQKEKVDPETLRRAQVVFSTIEMTFTPDVATLNIMGISEETKWNFSKSNPNFIEATDKKGKPINLEIVSLKENELVMKMGTIGSLIMKKKV